ncbi:hypothetical protein R1flu_001772 [Riccia fluitans]|uniref:Uncharacterized protein n=1 Tax=Riccia fluitans TaxID=41844 RepID=A0ABD1Y4A3_9MARC
MKVKTTARTWIAPATPTKKHWLSLSNLDRVVNPTFVSVIFFFEAPMHSMVPYVEMVSTLKDSLRKVLVHFYPLAGRLAMRDDGLVDLHCNDAGAMFFEAFVDQELSEATGGYGQTFPSLSGLEAARLGPGPVYLPDQLTALPVLIVQVTRFKCNSVSVAVNWHHTVADGYSGCHFVRSWSEVARGEPVSLIPVHTRELLRPRDSLDPSLVQQYSTDAIKTEDLRSVTHLKKAPPVSKVFHIAKESVQWLRNTVMAEQEKCARPLSTVEVMSAFLWKAMVSARQPQHQKVGDDIESKEIRTGTTTAADDLGNQNSTPEQPKRTRFFMFVDGRKRLNLPSGYFGNVVCSACAVSDEEEIRTRPLSHIGTLIGSATRGITEEYFRSIIDWVEMNGLTSASKSEHVNSVGQDVAGTFWIHFPLYEIDFGWGKPAFATRNAPPRPLIDGIGMIPSFQGPGNMAAVLNLHSDRMKNLERDPMFRSLFSDTPLGRVTEMS